ncbi:cytochrome b [Saezia sanguinis]|uniref:cytochrome b n=1 Tax=Saezia sanguinis TaxID=1965230 RepID=UPI0030310FB8
MTPARYHPTLTVLHWLLAALIILALAMGSLKLQHIPNSSPEKIMALRGHMMAGNLILLLTLIRFVLRLKTAHPAPVTTNSALLNRLATFMHYGLYLMVLLTAASGLVLAAQANLPAAVFEGRALLPASFSDFTARQIHGWAAMALLALIIGHALAALYHQFIRQDGLMRRMWFARKKPV